MSSTNRLEILVDVCAYLYKSGTGEDVHGEGGIAMLV